MLAAGVNPDWEKVFDWLASADRVQTFVSTGDAFNFLDIPEDMEDFMRNRRVTYEWRLQDLDKDAVHELLDFLCVCLHDPQAIAGCFYPHHTIIGRRGSESLAINICFSCANVQSEGAIKVGGHIDQRQFSKVGKLFGLEWPLDDFPCNCVAIFTPKPMAPTGGWPIGG